MNPLLQYRSSILSFAYQAHRPTEIFYHGGFWQSLARLTPRSQSNRSSTGTAGLGKLSRGALGTSYQYTFAVPEHSVGYFQVLPDIVHSSTAVVNSCLLTFMPSAGNFTKGSTGGLSNGETKMASTQIPASVNGVKGPTNGVDGTNGPTPNDRIQRFSAPSRSLSPRPEHTLFHDKTRCFV